MVRPYGQMDTPAFHILPGLTISMQRSGKQHRHVRITIHKLPVFRFAQLGIGEEIDVVSFQCLPIPAAEPVQRNVKYFLIYEIVPSRQGLPLIPQVFRYEYRAVKSRSQRQRGSD